MKKKMPLLLAFILIFSFAIGLLDGTVTEAAAKKPKLNIKKLEMTMNSTFNLRAYNLKKKQKVTYVSSNPDIATVEGKGKVGKKAVVTAISVGSCTINATVKKGKKVVRRLKCKLYVSPSAISIKFMRKKVTLRENNKLLLKTIIKPNSSLEQPIFESNDVEVATINSRGVVTAVGPGTATITATLLSTGQTATCTVTVREKREESYSENEDISYPKKKSNSGNDDIL